MASQFPLVNVSPNNPVFDLPIYVARDEGLFAKAGIDVRFQAKYSERAASNVHWAGYLAEIHSGLAELAAARNDPAAARAAWTAARDQLEPLAKAGRLAAQRKPLLDRARAGR